MRRSFIPLHTTVEASQAGGLASASVSVSPLRAAWAWLRSFPDSGRRIAELENACEVHKAVANGEWEKVYLLHAGPREGGFEFVMNTPISRVITAWAQDALASLEAPNWVEVAACPAGSFDEIIITFQRRRGQTPGEMIAELERQLADGAPTRQEPDASPRPGMNSK